MTLATASAKRKGFARCTHVRNPNVPPTFELPLELIGTSFCNEQTISVKKSSSEIP
jgi:hypothetical protein